MDILKVSIQITTASIPADHCKTVRFKGIKYLTHRITYQSYYHDILPASSRNEISHTLYLGSITSREVYHILKGWSFSMLTVETETLILCILSKRTIFLIKRARHALYFLVRGLVHHFYGWTADPSSQKQSLSNGRTGAWGIIRGMMQTSWHGRAQRTPCVLLSIVHTGVRCARPTGWHWGLWPSLRVLNIVNIQLKSVNPFPVKAVCDISKTL